MSNLEDISITPVHSVLAHANAVCLSTVANASRFLSTAAKKEISLRIAALKIWLEWYSISLESGPRTDSLWSYARGQMPGGGQALTWFAVQELITSGIGAGERLLRIGDVLDQLLLLCDPATLQQDLSMIRRAVFLAVQEGLRDDLKCDLNTLMNYPLLGRDSYTDFCSIVHDDDFADEVAVPPTLTNIIGWLYAATVWAAGSTSI